MDEEIGFLSWVLRVVGRCSIFICGLAVSICVSVAQGALDLASGGLLKAVSERPREQRVGLPLWTEHMAQPFHIHLVKKRSKKSSRKCFVLKRMSPRLVYRLKEAAVKRAGNRRLHGRPPCMPLNRRVCCGGCPR